MKLLGIVTTYNPNIDEFIRNTNSYLSNVDHLIIWDNTPGSCSDLAINLDKLNHNNWELRSNGNNDFLAKPFNICINEAIINGFTHVLTMDQDSYFTPNHFSEYTREINANTDESVMIYCPAKSENRYEDIKEIYVENAITSGAIYKLKMFEKTGFFKEDFLIYMIDIEFSMRVIKLGYRILCYPRILLNHHTGYAKKNQFGLKIDNYSAQSTYYIIRNVILNWRLYPENYSATDKINFIRYKIIYRTIKLIFENDPAKKLKAIYLGLVHGLIQKSGLHNV